MPFPSGGISKITSTGGTVTITNPSGPTTNLEVAIIAAPTVVSYAPASPVSYHLDSGSLAAIDSTNLTITRTAAASGRMLIEAEIVVAGTVTVNEPQIYFALVMHGTTTQVGVNAGILGSNVVGDIQVRVHASFLLTGLSAGTSYSFDLAYLANTSGIFVATAGASDTRGAAILKASDC